MPPRTRQQLEHRRDRRRAAARRRNRRVTLSVAIPAAISAVLMLVLWISGGRSTPTVEGSAVVPPLGPGAKPPDIPIATAGQVQLRLPMDPDRVTAIGFHGVDDPRVLTLTPAGPLPWHDMGGSGSGRAGVDVGARAGTVVYSPVDGRVIAVTAFVIRGRAMGRQYAISPSSDPGVVVVVNHVEDTLGEEPPTVGKNVQAGTTPLGQVVDVSGLAQQPIARYTAGEGNHVAITVARLANA